MGRLNEWNEKTQGIIHLMVTSICDRDCPLCCNKQYDLNTEVPLVTDEELRKAHTIYITGGEPFAYSNPNNIAAYLKNHYPNIKTVRVYTGATELAVWLEIDWNPTNGFIFFDTVSLKDFIYFDGVTVSLKNQRDVSDFEKYIADNEQISRLSSNMLYVFGDLMPRNLGNFIVKPRVWMEDFIPDNKSVFRRI